MKALDYDKLDAILGLEYNGEEIDTFEALEKQTIQAITLDDLQTMRKEIKNKRNYKSVDSMYNQGHRQGINEALEIIDKYIAKVKGETNE